MLLADYKIHLKGMEALVFLTKLCKVVKYLSREK
jgi:hypothetical protein